MRQASTPRARRGPVQVGGGGRLALCSRRHRPLLPARGGLVDERRYRINCVGVLLFGAALSVSYLAAHLVVGLVGRIFIFLFSER